MSEPGVSAGQRLDRWLWFARIFKSRSLAAKAIENGAVRITRGGKTVRTDKPSHGLKIGDIVTLSVHRHVRVLEVLSCGARRGPAAEARTLFRDLTAGVPTSGAARTEQHASPCPPARPSKRDRRALERLKGSDQLSEEDY